MNFPNHPDLQTEEIAPGYTILHISNAHATASIALHGAHITHYAPTGQDPVIFTSQSAIFTAGKAIRGGIPICWPWFGAYPDPSKNLPAHGYARTSFWELKSITSTPNATQLILQLPPQNDAPLQATLEVSIGKTLELTLTTENQSSEPQTFSEALHSYFAVSDTKTTEVLGLDGRDFIDTSTSPETQKKQSGPVYFPEEIDRIYSSDDDLTIIDPEKNRRILLQKTNSQSTIIWNPGPVKGAALKDLGNEEINQFICAEPGNVRNQSITLAPRSTHAITLKISTKPL